MNDKQPAQVADGARTVSGHSTRKVAGDSSAVSRASGTSSKAQLRGRDAMTKGAGHVFILNQLVVRSFFEISFHHDP